MPFHEFKEQALDVKGIIRSAEFSPYASVRIVAGSAFSSDHGIDDSGNPVSEKGRGGQRKPDSVEPLTDALHVLSRARMIIFLGRRSPGASSDLPGSRNGSGRSVSG